MVRPASFCFNRETAGSNSFQKAEAAASAPQDAALNEFDLLVNLLKISGIEVIVWNDSGEIEKPDAIFPNNWFSTHFNGKLVLYPMFAPNRRLERDKGLIDRLNKDFEIDETIDLTPFEAKGIFLEGTGSIVFDHVHKVAYACKSVRTSEEILSLLCNKLGYSYFLFNAFDREGKAVYHTNVLMCFGKDVAVVCLESVPESEREILYPKLKTNQRKIVEISLEQMENFAGNMLFLQSGLQRNFWVLSARALQVLRPEQRLILENSGELLVADISNIENIGGGGVRCMLAEIFLSRKSV